MGELRTLSVAVLFRGLEDLIRTSLGPTNQLFLQMPEDNLCVLADKTQLEMALLNTAVNARDALPEGSVFLLSAQVRSVSEDVELIPGQYVDLIARDTGHGMSPEVLRRAFDPFFTTKTVGKGSGLGLSQLYGMARRAGGTARLESGSQRGTTVIMTLRHSAGDGTDPEAVGSLSDSTSTTSAMTVLLVRE